MNNEQASTRAPAVLRAAAILDELVKAQGQALGVNELARLLAVPKSSVSNICAALQSVGAVERDDAGYRLGLRLAEWGGAFLDSHDYLDRFNDIVPGMEVIGAETVQVAVLAGLEVVYIARSAGRHPVRLASAIGRKLPAANTATGKALLARLPVDELERRLAELDNLPRITPNSITHKPALLHELETVRANGYALDNEETAVGIQCVAIAMDSPRPNDDPVAVSCTYIASRATPEFLEAVLDDLATLESLLADPFEARRRANDKDGDQ